MGKQCGYCSLSGADVSQYLSTHGFPFFHAGLYRCTVSPLDGFCFLFTIRLQKWSDKIIKIASPTPAKAGTITQTKGELYGGIDEKLRAQPFAAPMRPKITTRVNFRIMDSSSLIDRNAHNFLHTNMGLRHALHYTMIECLIIQKDTFFAQPVPALDILS